MRHMWRAKMRRWWLGLVSGSLQGGAVAVKAATFPAVLAGYQVMPALGVKQMLAVFLGAAIYHMWDYLSRNPLAEIAGPPVDDKDEKEAARDQLGIGVLPVKVNRQKDSQTER